MIWGEYLQKVRVLKIDVWMDVTHLFIDIRVVEVSKQHMHCILCIVYT